MGFVFHCYTGEHRNVIDDVKRNNTNFFNKSFTIKQTDYDIYNSELNRNLWYNTNDFNIDSSQNSSSLVPFYSIYPNIPYPMNIFFGPNYCSYLSSSLFSFDRIIFTDVCPGLDIF
jgi:hypothetical protein